MAERFVAVDCGKAETKVSVRVGSDNSILSSSFATRVIERDRNGNEFDDLFDSGNGNYRVEYDGKKFAVGNFVSEKKGYTSMQNSKKDIIHKVATLTAIGSMVNSGDTVRAVIGCPIKLYKNQQIREVYLDEILPKGKVEIRINGKDKSFFVTQTDVLPESMGAAIMFGEHFDEKAVGIIDIGGLNINCCVYRDHQLISETSFTEKLGRNVLIERLRDVLEASEDCEFHTYEIEQFIQQGYITNNRDSKKEEESKGFIRDFMKDHLKEILMTCNEHDWNMDRMDLIFIGGGSAMLSDYIRQIFPNAFIPKDPQFVNSEGFLKHWCRANGIHVRKK